MEYEAHALHKYISLHIRIKNVESEPCLRVEYKNPIKLISVEEKFLFHSGSRYCLKSNTQKMFGKREMLFGL